MYDYAKSVGDMSLMDLYADTLYRSDGDYMDIISSPYDVINKTFRMTIMPIGGGWTDIDEFVIKLTGGAGALMSLSGGLFAVAQTIYGFITSPINVDNIVNMAGVVMGKASEGASENAKNVLGWAGLFGSLFGVVGSMITTSKNLNITPTEYALNGKSRNDMIMLEYDFLHAVRTALGDNGFIVNEGRSTNNESLKNLNVIVLGSYTEEEVANKRWEIINIIKGVRNEKKYRGINLYYREIY
jgi:hypothetical protein